MRRKAAAAAVLAGACALTMPAFARVGGGGGYSGGGGSGGDGDGAGLIFALIRLLLWLVFAHPIVGIPLVIVIVIVVSKMAKSGAFRRGVRENPTVYPQPSSTLRRPLNLTPVRSTDPFFSEPVFIDFAQLVYARAQQVRGSGNRVPLETWMAKEAIDTLFADRDGLTSVSDVVFGATRIVQAATEGGFVRLDVEFASNLTETRAGATAQVLCNEKWSFRRKAGARSPAPARMRALGCVGCGSTLEPRSDGTCASCGAALRGGLMQWEVQRIPYANRRPLTPPELEAADGDRVERGTDFETVLDPGLSAARRTFEGRHPDHSWPAFEARVRETFLALQDAWSRREWDKARPFETDALFQTHRFWMERFAAFSYVNHVDRVEVTRVTLAKIDLDAYYESITVRIFARSLDWTENAAGAVVGGSKTSPRAFSEYWTFLRAIPGAVVALSSCPSCGAELPPGGGATVCAYCGGKLIGDALDWVASRIEQDDAYA